MMRNLESGNLEVSDLVRELAAREVNLITPITPGQPNDELLNVGDEMVWVQVPCAVDSGACANVAPEGVFKLADATTPKLDPKYFGADGTPIVNLGALIAEGISEEGTELKIDFDLAKVTRPLLHDGGRTSSAVQ